MFYIVKVIQQDLENLIKMVVRIYGHQIWDFFQVL